MNIKFKKLNFDKMNGLIPAVIQDDATGTVLMLGFMNQEALQKTIKTKMVTFWSRTKKRLWQKGETSGNFLKVINIYPDCDNDSLLIAVKPQGPACHTGKFSCFTKKSSKNGNFIKILYTIIQERKKSVPKNSYTSFLFNKGLKKILAKVTEESKEVIKAATKETKQRLIEESCDLIYHLFVLLVNENINLSDLEKELAKRNAK